MATKRYLLFMYSFSDMHENEGESSFFPHDTLKGLKNTMSSVRKEATEVFHFLILDRVENKTYTGKQVLKISEDFDWVITEWLPIFEPFDTHTRAKETCKTRMKALFKEFNDLEKKEVIEGTKLYVDYCIEEEKYPREPRYFIFKGRGGDKTYDLIDWIETYHEKIKKRDLDPEPPSASNRYKLQ